MLLSELAPACNNRLDLHTACSVRDVQEAAEVLGVQGRGDTLCQDEYVCPDSCMHIFLSSVLMMLHDIVMLKHAVTLILTLIGIELTLS